MEKRGRKFRTLNDGEQNDNDEEKETDVEKDSVNFIIITIWGLDDITNTAACSNALVQVEHKTLRKRKIMIRSMNRMGSLRKLKIELR